LVRGLLHAALACRSQRGCAGGERSWAAPEKELRGLVHTPETESDLFRIADTSGPGDRTYYNLMSVRLPQTRSARGTHRPEVRWILSRRRREHQARRPADRGNQVGW